MRTMQQNIELLRNAFNSELLNVTSTADLENLKIKYLGKKGPIQWLKFGD